MPYPCLIQCNMKVSRRFHADFFADFRQNGFWNPSGMVPESQRNRSGILTESYPNLSMPYPCLIPCKIKMSRRFHAEWVAESYQNGSRIVAESQRNLSGILAEAIYALSMLVFMQHEDFTQILCRFHAEGVPESFRNGSGIVAES